MASLLDLSATILGWAGCAPLPGHAGRDLRRIAAWPDTCTSSYYGGLMNIRLPPLRHRMLRRGRHKLVWFDGAPPVLVDLEADPDELVDLAAEPAHGALLRDLAAELLDGWNPAAIADLQEKKAARVGVIREWVRATRPDEPVRWKDPDVTRNRLE